MKKSWAFGAAALAVAIVGVTPVPPPVAGYKLVWNQDFRVPRLDPNTWNVSTQPRDDAVQTADAVITDENGLHLRTYTENGVNHTGFLTTKGHFMTTFGYFEARMQFHGAPGEWCAFWLMPPHIGQVLGDPQDSGVETDIIEHRLQDRNGNDIRNVAAFNLHWDGYGKYHKHAGSTWRAPESLDGTWHTYAVLWTPEKYAFYVDGVQHWETSAAVSHTAEDLQITCEIRNGGWAGQVPPGGYGDKQSSHYGVDVDWVHVWQPAS